MAKKTTKNGGPALVEDVPLRSHELLGLAGKPAVNVTVDKERALLVLDALDHWKKAIEGSRNRVAGMHIDVTDHDRKLAILTGADGTPGLISAFEIPEVAFEGDPDQVGLGEEE